MPTSSTKLPRRRIHTKPIPRWKRLTQSGRLSRKEITKRTGRTAGGHLTEDHKRQIIKLACFTKPYKTGWRWRYNYKYLASVFEVSAVTISRLCAPVRAELRHEKLMKLTAAYYAGARAQDLADELGITVGRVYHLLRNKVGQHPNMQMHEDDEL